MSPIIYLKSNFQGPTSNINIFHLLMSRKKNLKIINSQSIGINSFNSTADEGQHNYGLDK